MSYKNRTHNPQQSIYDILIVGAGISGVACALWAAERKLRVILVEREDRILNWLGKSGEDFVVLGNAGERGHGIVQRGTLAGNLHLDMWTGELSLNWLSHQSVGIEKSSLCYGLGRENTNQFRASLLGKLQSLGVVIEYNRSVESFKQEKDGHYRIWFREGEAMEAGSMVLATGGERNHGLKLAHEIGGAEITPPFPGFIRLKENRLFNQIGEMERRVELKDEKSGEKSVGHLRLSGRGLEGEAISRLSSSVGLEWEKLKYSVHLVIDWLPEKSGTELRREIQERQGRGGRQEIGEDDLLGFSRRSWLGMLKIARINGKETWARIQPKQVSRLVQVLKGTHCQSKGMGLPSGERSWAGGVASESWDWKTGESLKLPGLYYCGEILDILGEPGGWQGTLCLASAHVVGNAVRKWEG